MSFRLLALGLVSFTLTVTACSRVEVTKLQTQDNQLSGVRFYRPWPYLARYQGKDGGCTDSIVFLPDLEQEYVVRWYSGMGSVDAKMNLENGWNLVSFGQTRDTKIPETIAAVSGILKTAIAPGAAPSVAPCDAGLRKMKYDTTKKEWVLP